MYVRPHIRGWHCSQDTGRLTTALRTRRRRRQNNDASKKSPEITQQYHRPGHIMKKKKIGKPQRELNFQLEYTSWIKARLT